jgi:uncharacterized membrane protein
VGHDESMDYQITVDIKAPPETVWAVMSDAERWHEWTDSVRSIRLIDKGPLAVGTRAFVRQPRFPPAVWKVTDITPGKSFTWRTGAPGIWVYGRHSVDAIPGGSRATLRLNYEGAIGNLMARLTRDIANRYLAYEAAGLKKRSESLVSG